MLFLYSIQDISFLISKELAYFPVTIVPEQTTEGTADMKPSERRQKIIELLCQRRHETMKNLASEFGVSIRTIYYDIVELSTLYPILTIQGKYGGVYMREGYFLGKKYLSLIQQELLERLVEYLDGSDREIILSILRDFALKRD